MNDEDLAREALTVDPTRSTITLLIGGKGCGKSEAARIVFDSWPADRLVIDPTGDARPDDPATIALVAPFPSQLPEPDPEADPPQTRVTVWARINPGSATLKADQNDATNMALHPRHRRKLIWRDEFGLGVSANTMTDADRTLLMSSRHYEASALLCCPRPRHMPVLALAQADRILVWALPNPDDREHVAKNFGVSLPLFEREYHDNRRRGRHAFLLLDRHNDALLNCPPLPGVKARGPKA
jgi:hypothetical protein